MVEGGVIRRQVEEQSQTATPKALAQPGQGRVAAEILVDSVGAYGERRAANVVLGEARQRLGVGASPFLVFARRTPAFRPGLPDAEQPNPVEALRRQPIRQRIRHVVQRGPRADLVSKNAGVQLDQGGE